MECNLLIHYCAKINTKFSVGSSEAGSYRGEEQIVGGVLELAYCRAARDGQAFPARERHRVLD